MYKHILIATDGSEIAQRAVTHGLTLAKSVGAQAFFLTATKMWSAIEMGGMPHTGSYIRQRTMKRSRPSGPMKFWLRVGSRLTRPCNIHDDPCRRY